tara:strand:- start:713 stop:844 length:132 start_codon:yes stop_codon:yes gene_type:complete
MKLTMKNTKAELYDALKKTKSIQEERTALMFIAAFFFVTTCLF